MARSRRLLPRLAFVAQLALSAVGCAPPPPLANCPDNTACDQCVRAAGCGWCANTGRCVAGGATGPMDMAACPAELFRFGAGGARTCDDPCATNRTCGDCAIRVGCGWCTDGNRCVAGGSTGPASGSCPAAQWRFTPSTCP